MALLTPREFTNIFPIEKVYDGAKYETKDYFFTVQAIEKIGWDSVIDDDIVEFLWDYTNIYVSLFLVEMLGCTSDIEIQKEVL
jgi:hypothetical protein